jgi:transglutaminase-like putative cysteine protease
MAEYVAPVSTEKSLLEIHVNKDWTVRQRMEVVNKVETEQGIAQLGEQKITYNSAHERVRVIKAYTVHPDGTKDMVTPDRIRTQDDQDDTSNGVYSESKVKVIIFPNVRVGSKTYYLVESFEHTPDFPNNFTWSEYFSPHRKYGQAEVRFSHASSLDIKVIGRGMTGGRVDDPASAKRGVTRYLFRYTQDSADPVEPNMVSYVDYAPQFSASSFKSYADVAKAYQDRARLKASTTPEITAHARKVIGDAVTEQEKVKRLYVWVSRNIRYLGVFAGSGGYVPHSAQSIFRARYGDCKDHATLLEALMRAVGIESSQVLINSDRSYKLPEIPSAAVFDHVITYVPSLGLFLDSTSRFTPMGLLPEGVVGKPGLITATGQVITTPLDDTEKDKTITSTKMTLHPDGRVTGTSQVEQFGYFQLISRVKVYRSQNKPQEEVVGNMLARFNESGTGRIEHADPLDLDAAWVVNSEFSLDPVANLPGVVALTLPIGLAQGRFQTLASIKALVKSKFPHICGSSSHKEVIEMNLPVEARITRVPNDVRFKSQTLSYHAIYQTSGKTVQVTRTFEANRGRSVCGREDDLEWDQFTKVLQRDLRQQYFLE